MVIILSFLIYFKQQFFFQIQFQTTNFINIDIFIFTIFFLKFIFFIVLINHFSHIII